MDTRDQEAKVATEVPIWERAHRTLNDIRNGLMQERDELQKRQAVDGERISQINCALDRINPPGPIAISGGGAAPQSEGFAQPKNNWQPW